MSFLRQLSEVYGIPIFSKSKLLNKLRIDWEEPPIKWRDYSNIETLLKLTHIRHKHGVIDDKTWHDLGMDAIFSRADTTLTEIGQQFLYRKMHLLEIDKNHLKHQYDFARKIQIDQSLREQLQTALYPLSLLSVKSTVKSLFDQFDSSSLRRMTIIGWVILSTVILLSSYFLQSGINYFLAILVILSNLFIVRPIYLKTSENNAYTLHCMNKILSVAKTLALKKDSTNPLFINLNDQLSAIRITKWQLNFLLISQSNHNLLISYPMYLVNLFLAIDMLIYVFLIKSIHNNLKTIRSCFLTLGELDASIALASYLKRHPHHCNPDFTHNNHLNLENAYHPLVDNYVVNSYKSTGKSALITGSNMAGKTTFIRAIGINVVLSRTLWICHADRALIPFVNVSSSISNTDFLEGGKSYYFTELEHINKFLQLTQNDDHYLFLIDEIFRGTNTAERIGGAASVLQALAVKDIVLVTTHDIELERFLHERYEFWHFQDTGKKELPFDYKIRSGVCRSKNALKLMEDMGYPDHIIDRAKAIADKMDKKYSSTR